MLSKTDQPLLSLACYCLVFETGGELRLPDYAGSAWRGAFGNALRRLVCVTRAPACDGCLLYRSCTYPYIFNTPTDPSAGKLNKYSEAPHPYVLTPGPQRGILEKGAAVTLNLTLFGHGLRQLPYVIHALTQAGERGLTARRTPLILRSVWQQDETHGWQMIYQLGAELRPAAPLIPQLPPCPPRLQIRLETPLRVKRGGHFATPERFDFAALFSGLLRRISLLMTFHGDSALSTDFKALSQAARTVALTRADLHWREYTRYSSRQKTAMQLGGVMGKIELEGAELAPFWPYLWLGQWTHAGKMATMGLGRYRIDADKLAGPASFDLNRQTGKRVKSE